MTDQTIHQIVTDYFASLPNKDIPHSRYLILFSGMVASGKTTHAKEIEHELLAVRLSNDEIRRRIVEVEPGVVLENREEAKSRAVTELLKQVLGIANGLIVVDASCDRGDGAYFAWANKYSYRIILLRIEVDREIIEQRLRVRDDQDYRKTERLLSMVDKWWADWEAFGKTHQPDMLITPETRPWTVAEKVRQIMH